MKYSVRQWSLGTGQVPSSVLLYVQRDHKDYHLLVLQYWQLWHSAVHKNNVNRGTRKFSNRIQFEDVSCNKQSLQPAQSKTNTVTVTVVTLTL